MPVPQPVVPIARRELLQDLVYKALHKAIIDGTLKPGDPLRESEILARFGGTRTSLRIAIRKLVYDGFVETRPQSGTVVAPCLRSRIPQALSVYRCLIMAAIHETTARLTSSDDTAFLAALHRLDHPQGEMNAMEFFGMLYRPFLLILNNAFTLQFADRAYGELMRGNGEYDFSNLSGSPAPARVIAAALERDTPTTEEQAAAHFDYAAKVIASAIEV
ncbi:GntR family transcriptional regulator [Paeniglutamicibacter sp. NPDC012692]|uniref:GntR family transcriptional regulator n=1 Tax=Paeniglutamicibacter sp. NPDC012692 TaxID=3364388 RepID=UPI003689DEDF